MDVAASRHAPISSGAQTQLPAQARRAYSPEPTMRSVIVRHGETDWTLAGRYTGATEVLLTANGRRQATSIPLLLDHVLDGQSPVLVSSPRRRAIETATLALPDRDPTIDPLVAEFDYGDYEGLTGEQIRRRAPGWDIWRDGCPHGESTADVGMRADEFLRTPVAQCTGPLIVVTHGHFSRILAARTLGLAPEYGRLFASIPASVSLIETTTVNGASGYGTRTPP